MSTATLTPAYGRDYKSQREVQAGILAGHDFILNDVASPWDGKPCSPRDIGERVRVRYHDGRRVGVFSATTGEPVS